MKRHVILGANISPATQPVGGRRLTVVTKTRRSGRPPPPTWSMKGTLCSWRNAQSGWYAGWVGERSPAGIAGSAYCNHSLNSIRWLSACSRYVPARTALPFSAVRNSAAHRASDRPERRGYRRSNRPGAGRVCPWISLGRKNPGGSSVHGRVTPAPRVASRTSGWPTLTTMIRSMEP